MTIFHVEYDDYVNDPPLHDDGESLLILSSKIIDRMNVEGLLPKRICDSDGNEYGWEYSISIQVLENK